MESPGGEIRASQEGLGKLRLEQSGGGGHLGKGDAGAPARARGSLTWREQGGRSPLQSADTKPGSPRGRDARPGRGARRAGSLSARSAAARPRPNPAPGSDASASHSAGLGVSSPGRGSQSGSRPCPLRAPSVRPARARLVSGT